MEDFDANAVLPTPATFYDNFGNFGQAEALGSRGPLDPMPLNMADLDDLISPVDCETAIFGEPPAEDVETASDDDIDGDASSEFGEHSKAFHHDDMFPFEMPEEKPLAISLDTPLRTLKVRPHGEKRYSPFPAGAMSPGRPRARPVLSSNMKLSTSLPSGGILPPAGADNKKCACCGCSKYGSRESS